MSDGFDHYMKIMEAAMPCLPASARHSCSILLKADDLVKNLRPPQGELHATSFEQDNFQFDPEKLLEHILPVCNPAEQNMIHQLLNFMRAQKLYRNYQEYQKNTAAFSQNTSAKAGSVPDENFESDVKEGTGNPSDSSSHPNMMDFLLSQLNPAQRETLNAFQSLIS